jgi:NAD(P)-dependent dehydrogenase (short-subunit alcohol dehydrogenase family)
VSVSSAGQAPIDFDDVMLERSYSGIQAYCQSKLAQIMMTFDVAGGDGDPSVVATALHPSTYMPTKIVHSPVSTIADGVRATSRLIWQLPAGPGRRPSTSTSSGPQGRTRRPTTSTPGRGSGGCRRS